MSAKNAFTSPARNQGFRALVFKAELPGSYHAVKEFVP
jgi:hypothetical protein